jgi:DNA-binding MarR family transcriptional regulator
LNDHRFRDIFAVVQTTAVSTEQLTGELLGFAAWVTKSAQPDVLDVVAGLDLSLSQLRALHVLDAAAQPLALHELADHVGLSVGATGRAVDSLVRTGLVSRREDEADRRVKRIAISDAGRETIMRIVSARRNAVRAVVESMADDERDALSRALAPLLARPEVQTICKGVSA